jgi:hypothetical protein
MLESLSESPEIIGLVKVLFVNVSDPARVAKSASVSAVLNSAIEPEIVLLPRASVLLVNVCAVLKSTVVPVFILKVFPVNVRPLPAWYVPAPENCVNWIGSVPRVVTVFVCTHPVLSFTVPPDTKTKSPGSISEAVL